MNQTSELHSTRQFTPVPIVTCCPDISLSLARPLMGYGG
jgi:hypothetical protein